MLPTAAKVNRDMRRGILKYVQQRGNWILHLIEGRDGEQQLAELKAWGCTGIIGRTFTPALARLVVNSRLPSVISYISADWPLLRCRNPRHGRICCDNDSVGRMGAKYLLAQKFPHYAFVRDIPNMPWSRERRLTFVRTVEAAGFKCHLYPLSTSAQAREASVEQRRLAAWLKSLPKPVAVMVATDPRGRQVLEACAQADIAVPREVAVLSVDNDEELCETTYPSMSSIMLTAEDAGYRGAETLDQYMRGTLRRHTVITFGPSHVVPRKSTEIVRVNDPLVGKALEFISLNVAVPFGVPDVVSHLKVSRRLIEMRFREVLGHTVLDEIRRVRLERVCRLLKESDLPICEITRACGFDNQSCLGRLFRQRHECTMREYRLKSVGVR
jgi:LacI family transcriptional regulator